jgi:hypothetical protein
MSARPRMAVFGAINHQRKAISKKQGKQILDRTLHANRWKPIQKSLIYVWTLARVYRLFAASS